MDVTLEWKESDDPDSLVRTILECKKELTKACFSMHSAARIHQFDVLASKQICDFLTTVGSHDKPKDKTRDTTWMKSVCDFKQFKLFNFKHVGNKTIRVLALFDVGVPIMKQWYGNVLIT